MRRGYASGTTGSPAEHRCAMKLALSLNSAWPRNRSQTIWLLLATAPIVSPASRDGERRRQRWCYPSIPTWNLFQKIGANGIRRSAEPSGFLNPSLAPGTKLCCFVRSPRFDSMCPSSKQWKTFAGKVPAHLLLSTASESMPPTFSVAPLQQRCCPYRTRATSQVHGNILIDLTDPPAALAPEIFDSQV